MKGKELVLGSKLEGLVCSRSYQNKYLERKWFQIYSFARLKFQ